MNTHGPLGDITRHQDHSTLRFRRSLRHSAEKVWIALTESEHMRWWMPVDMIGDRDVGSTVAMVFWPDLVDKKGLDPDAGTATIRECEPMRVFEWAWHETVVRFEIDPTPAGCDLTLTVELGAVDPDTIVDNAGGFHIWMDHLTALLDDGSTLPIADANTERLDNKYRDAVGRS